MPHWTTPWAKPMSRIVRSGCLLQWPSPSYIGVSEFAGAKALVMQGSKEWQEEHSAGYLPYTNNKLY